MPLSIRNEIYKPIPKSIYESYIAQIVKIGPDELIDKLILARNKSNSNNNNNIQCADNTVSMEDKSEKSENETSLFENSLSDEDNSLIADFLNYLHPNTEQIRFKMQHHLETLINSEEIKSRIISKLGIQDDKILKNYVQIVISDILNKQTKIKIASILVTLIKNDLLSLIKTCPSFEELPLEEQEKLSIQYPEKPQSSKIFGVMQRSFATITTNSPDIFIGPTGLDACLGIVIHSAKKTVVMHYDENTYASSIINTLNEFTKEELLEVYLCGACAPIDEVRVSNLQAEANLKETLYALYKYAKDFNIKICYANILEKTETYRKWHAKTADDVTVNIIYNREGKLVLTPNPHYSKQPCPYIEIENSLFLFDIFKRGVIWLFLRQQMEFPDRDLNKVYDGSNLGWNTEQLKKWNDNCLKSAIKIIIRELNKHQFATALPNQDPELSAYLSNELSAYNMTPTEHRETPIFIYHMLIYLTVFSYLYYNRKIGFAKNGDEAKVRKLEQSSAIYKLLKSNEIKMWCRKNVCLQIVNYMKHNSNSNVTLNDLQSITSDLHLLTDFIDYKIFYYKKQQINTLISIENNLLKMLDENNDRKIADIIDDWKLKKIATDFETNIAQNLYEELDVPDTIQITEQQITQILLKKMYELKDYVLPQIHKESDKKFIKKLIKEILKAFSPSSSICCLPLQSHHRIDDIKAKLESIVIAVFKNTVPVSSIATHSFLGGKEEVDDDDDDLKQGSNSGTFNR